MFLCVAILLIVSPRSRTILFPPAPLALVDSKTGGLQKPKSGMLGSHDSLTGAPEKHQGEAVEQEASNFVNGFANLAVSSATGQHPDNGAHGEEGSMASTVPDPTRVVTAASDAKVSAAAGEKAPVRHDKTRQPVEATMWEKARPATHMVADIADGWERFAKYGLISTFNDTADRLQCFIADSTISSKCSTPQTRCNLGSHSCRLSCDDSGDSLQNQLFY